MEEDVRNRWMAMILVLISMLAVMAVADTTVKSKIVSKGIGGFANTEGTQQVMISGNKEKMVSNLKMTNKVVKFLGGGKPQESAEITRIDREVIWHLNLKDKEYTELTFAEMKALTEKGLAEAQKERGASKHEGDSMQFSADVKVEPTGKSQTIAGYKADEVVVTMVFQGKDSASGKSGKMKMVMDMWLSKDVPGQQEYHDFYKSLAEKLGLPSQSQTGMDNALKGFGIDSKAVYEKMKDVDGMPLMTDITIVPEGMDSLLAQVTDSVDKADQAEKVEQAKTDEPTDAKGTAMKKLGGLFGKKKKDKDKAATANEAKPSEPPSLFHITTTVTEVSSAAIPASEFEIPQGFKLSKN
jgi:hypothetical protein